MILVRINDRNKISNKIGIVVGQYVISNDVNGLIFEFVFYAFRLLIKYVEIKTIRLKLVRTDYYSECLGIWL